MELTKQIIEVLEKYDIEAKLNDTRFTCCLTSYTGKLNTADITFSETSIEGTVHIFKCIVIKDAEDVAELENFLKAGSFKEEL